MGYIFDDWKALLDSFQQSVEKDLEEIHQQKAEVQQIKTDIFNKVESGLFYHDQKRIVISAPEIIIGNVDKSGTLQGGMGKVIIKGSEVGLEGVGETGQIINRAPSIRQLAVDPGIDGLENVVCETSQVISQACEITLHSSDAKDAFSQVPVSAGKGGVSIHADKSLNFEAAVSAEERKAQIEAVVKELKAQGDDLKKQVAAQKKNVDDCFKKMSELLDEENKLNKDDAFLGRVSVRDISEIHEEMEDIMPALYQSTQSFIHLVAQLAEVNRKKKALETEKDEIKSNEPLYSAEGPFTDKMIQRVPVEQRISGVDRARYPAEQDHADDPEAVWIEIRKQFRDAEKGKSFLFFVFVHASPPFRHISSVHLWFTHQCRHLRSASLSAREPISTQAVRRRL